MGLLRRLFGMFTGRRSRTTSTTHRRGLASRLIAALKTFFGGGRSRTRTRI